MDNFRQDLKQNKWRTEVKINIEHKVSKWDNCKQQAMIFLGEKTLLKSAQLVSSIDIPSRSSVPH